MIVFLLLDWLENIRKSFLPNGSCCLETLLRLAWASQEFKMNQNLKVVIAGGSGFLGVSLATHLTQLGHEVVILSRNAPKCSGPWSFMEWDARTLGDWTECLGGADAMVNLVGRTVDCIKTPENKDVILRSRVEATRVLGQAVAQMDQPPSTWGQMSTAHIYGDPPERLCTEESPIGMGLAPEVGVRWETEFERAHSPKQRGVVLRTSFVVGRDRGAGGGALQRLKFITRLGLGGRVGKGTQGMSWIHEKDFNRVVEQAIIQSAMQGIYNVTSDQPVSQQEFMRQLRKAMRMPIGFPATEWMARFGAHYIFRTDPELAIYVRYVAPQRLISEGFRFEFPALDEALADLV